MKVRCGPSRPLVDMDPCETPSQYMNLPNKTLQHKTFNAIFDNNGRGYDDLPRALKNMYIIHIGQGQDRVLGTLCRKININECEILGIVR